MPGIKNELGGNGDSRLEWERKSARKETALKREFARQQSQMQSEMAELRARIYKQDAHLLNVASSSGRGAVPRSQDDGYSSAGSGDGELSGA